MARLRFHGYELEGLADRYAQNRPRPPAPLVDLLCQVADVERPRLVVDLGSGTGLSTRSWAARSERVVGIEPNPAMLRVAESEPVANVDYVRGTSDETGVPAGTADIVTAAQSLHWMDADPTFAEAARVLRPGGVFAAYDYEFLPAIHPDVDDAFDAFLERAYAYRRERGFDAGRDSKAGHLERIRASGRFRSGREYFLHSVERGDAARVLGFALTQGPVAQLLAKGVTERELGLDVLREVAGRVVGDRPRRWWFSYRLRVGIV